jgi:hypothetical protein
MKAGALGDFLRLRGVRVWRGFIMDQSLGAERVARNQLLFRSVNEKLEGVNEMFGSLTNTYAVLCECADTDCVEQIEVTVEEYRAVREQPDHFIVAVGHGHPEHEQVVKSGDGYQVVEKVGRAGEIARNS